MPTDPRPAAVSTEAATAPPSPAAQGAIRRPGYRERQFHAQRSAGQRKQFYVSILPRQERCPGLHRLRPVIAAPRRQGVSKKQSPTHELKLTQETSDLQPSNLRGNCSE